MATAAQECAVCESTQVKACGRCRSAFYCSTAHAKLLWPLHKRFCGTGKEIWYEDNLTTEEIEKAIRIGDWVIDAGKPTMNEMIGLYGGRFSSLAPKEFWSQMNSFKPERDRSWWISWARARSVDFDQAHNVAERDRTLSEIDYHLAVERSILYGPDNTQRSPETFALVDQLIHQYAIFRLLRTGGMTQESRIASIRAARMADQVALQETALHGVATSMAKNLRLYARIFENLF